jgi:hypothetical protein
VTARVIVLAAVVVAATPGLAGSLVAVGAVALIVAIGAAVPRLPPAAGLPAIALAVCALCTMAGSLVAAVVPATADGAGGAPVLLVTALVTLLLSGDRDPDAPGGRDGASGGAAPDAPGERDGASGASGAAAVPLALVVAVVLLASAREACGPAGLAGLHLPGALRVGLLGYPGGVALLAGLIAVAMDHRASPAKPGSHRVRPPAADVDDPYRMSARCARVRANRRERSSDGS